MGRQCGHSSEGTLPASTHACRRAYRSKNNSNGYLGGAKTTVTTNRATIYNSNNYSNSNIAITRDIRPARKRARRRSTPRVRDDVRDAFTNTYTHRTRYHYKDMDPLQPGVLRDLLQHEPASTAATGAAAEDARVYTRRCHVAQTASCHSIPCGPRSLLNHAAVTVPGTAPLHHYYPTVSAIKT